MKKNYYDVYYFRVFFFAQKKKRTRIRNNKRRNKSLQSFLALLALHLLSSSASFGLSTHVDSVFFLAFLLNLKMLAFHVCLNVSRIYLQYKFLFYRIRLVVISAFTLGCLSLRWCFDYFMSFVPVNFMTFVLHALNGWMDRKKMIRKE